MESADSTERIQNMIASTIRAVQDGEGKVKGTVAIFDDIVRVTQGISGNCGSIRQRTGRSGSRDQDQG